MIEYIKNIIPRIKSFSQKVDKEELLIGKTWVWVGFDQGYTTFHFLRDNRLLISQLGNVQEGKWEFIGNNQLLNVRGERFNVLLNNGILFEGVLIMQKQGVLDNFEVLYDEQVIPDGNIVGYIESRIPRVRDFPEDPIEQSIYPLTVVVNESELTFSKKPSIGDVIISKTAFTGKISSLYNNIGVVIEDNQIKSVFLNDSIITDKGIIDLEVTNCSLDYPSGTGVFRNNKNAPDGKFYVTSNSNNQQEWVKIYFEKGNIKSVGFNTDYEMYIILLTSILLPILILYIIFASLT